MNEDSVTPVHPATHAHTSRCWWDYTKPGWICPTGEENAPRSTTPIVSEVDHAEVDTRDMVVVHTAMLREFRLLSGAVAGVADGDRVQARVVEDHLRLVCDLLHHHHEGEDELLWPLMYGRLPANLRPLLERAEAQHEGLHEALGAVGVARHAWIENASTVSRDALVQALESLSVLLTEHLDDEERNLLPLAATYLTAAEWHAIGEHGAASTPKPALPLVFGMFAYEGDPVVLKAMLASAPLVPRLLVPRLAPSIYARRAAKVYGTRTP
ncbi:Hemerythrin HHE cation binding domain-containing protein [Nocardioides scoriae]|uniref:Hemerythrin HHE cation binding domain-containing protein n=1 Tax=Nocardioides scoriae TaxID=642780 RepID=A0A1H1LDA8_9ACTN|nr:hemerythrin domain-containing protein [Nocardioides scoriae]SDR72486.1 Hemerythrin HHE cation binding domain-containing protein [Nocardioides scoriae]